MFRLAGPLIAAAVLGVAARDAHADPAGATVLIRVVGEVTAALGYDTRTWRPSVELREVQLAAGSGFIISPAGYILTNSHVIRSERVRAIVEGRPVDLTLSVQRIYAVLAGDAGPERAFEAVVVADDPDADLAVLSIGGQDLPVVPLGDAAVLQRGDSLMAWGYPLGDLLSVEAAGERGAPPVSAVSGSVATLRDGGVAGLPASVPYIQFTAPINPGASGGPLTDRDGFAVGVVQATLRQAEGLAFAISIDEVKRFLERTGIDAMLPVTRLTAGPAFEMADKGIRMRVPAGFVDESPLRTRIDSGSSLAQVRLVVDRIATPWDAARMERALLEGRDFGQDEYTALTDRVRGEQPRDRLRMGLAKRLGESGETRMMYALADAGDEIVVARYVAPAEDVGFNFSVLRDSLGSMEVTPLAPRPLAVPLGRHIVPLPAMTQGVPIGVVPANTTIEQSGSPGCAGLAAASGSLSAALESDFTVRFVASWWSADTSAADLRRSCLGPGAARSSHRRQHFGLTWVVQRTVITTSAGQPVLLELWAPEARTGLAVDAWLAWAKAAGTASPGTP